MGYVGLLYVALEIQWGAQKPNWSVWTTSIAWASYERMRPGVYPKPPELGGPEPQLFKSTSAWDKGLTCSTPPMPPIVAFATDTSHSRGACLSR